MSERTKNLIEPRDTVLGLYKLVMVIGQKWDQLPEDESVIMTKVVEEAIRTFWYSKSSMSPLPSTEYRIRSRKNSPKHGAALVTPTQVLLTQWSE